MVKKAGIFERLRGRFSGGPMRVKEDEPAPRQTAPKPGAKARKSAEPSKAAPQPQNRIADAQKPPATPAVAARPIAASSRKMTKQEESQAALESGLQDLAGLLRGVQERLEGPATHVARLPELAEAQLAALRAVADRLDRQEVSQERVTEHLKALPDTLSGVRDALERAAATDARTASTLTDFKSDMAQIQSAMGDLVSSGKEQAEQTKATAEAANKQASHSSVKADSAERANRELLAELRRTQDAQAQRLGALSDQSKATQQTTVRLLAALLAVLGVVALTLLFR